VAEPLSRDEALRRIKERSAAEHAAFLAWQQALDDLRVACYANSKHVLARSHPDYLRFADMAEAMDPPRDLTRPSWWCLQLVRDTDGIRARLAKRRIPLPAALERH
jgi:hypothetical protein